MQRIAQGRLVRRGEFDFHHGGCACCSPADSGDVETESEQVACNPSHEIRTVDLAQSQKGVDLKCGKRMVSLAFSSRFSGSICLS
jgi:hypothetical protein